jgi:hypothetical protein
VREYDAQLFSVVISFKERRAHIIRAVLFLTAHEHVVLLMCLNAEFQQLLQPLAAMFKHRSLKRVPSDNADV